MRTQLNMSIIVVLSLGLFACGDTIDEKEAPSKTEITDRVKDGDTTDYCTSFGWYEDGKCDTFCSSPDPDCGQCGAVPVCEQGYEEVNDCILDDAACKEETMCGSTILCRQIMNRCGNDNGDVAFVLECPEGYRVDRECVQDIACIEKEDMCGDPYVCVEEVEVCNAPACEAGFIEIEACRFDDPQCVTREGCEVIVSCVPDQGCAATPFCAGDEVQHNSREECLKNNQICRPDYRCNQQIWCSPQLDCALPFCSDNEEEVSECTKNMRECREEKGCGVSLICQTI